METRASNPASNDPLHQLYDPLMIKGSIIDYPSAFDSLIGPRDPVRLAMAKRGLYIAAVNSTQFVDNLSDPPIPSAQQSYVGQRPTWVEQIGPAYLTYDMRALHIRGGQLQVYGYVEQTNWGPGNPITSRLERLAYYQELFHDRLELKGGILDQENEFFGMQVGGVVTASAIGNYAKIPFVVGVAHSPYGTPAINIRYHYPKHFYSTLAFTRSTDRRGQNEEVQRDAIGLRFDPAGDGMATIVEGGYRTRASATDNYTWVRAGTIYNTTHYSNYKTGGATSNNQAVYLLADRQFWKPDTEHPARGFYGGFTAMYAPPAQNSYTQSYELRLYDFGPFRSHPKDLFSVVVDHLDYSEFYTRNQLAAGKTAWNSSTAVSVGYSWHVRNGLYFAPGVSWTRGAAITPRVPDSVTAGGSFYYTF